MGLCISLIFRKMQIVDLSVFVLLRHLLSLGIWFSQEVIRWWVARGTTHVAILKKMSGSKPIVRTTGFSLFVDSPTIRRSVSIMCLAC